MQVNDSVSTSMEAAPSSMPTAHLDDLRNREKAYNSSFMVDDIKRWWLEDVIGPFERWLIKKRPNPDFLTWAGVLINTLAAACFATGHVLPAGILIITGGNFDFLDGRVARATNQVTKSGGFLDSVTDRYVDLFLFTGLIIHFRSSWMLIPCLAALIGSIMVSYTRARAEAAGIDCKSGAMQRTERIAYLGIGSIMSGLVTISLIPFWSTTDTPPQYILAFVVIVIAAMSNIVAFQRTREGYLRLKREFQK